MPAALTRAVVRETLVIVATELRTKFGIAHPRIAVCGLNPHAGEGGHLGREEIDVIAPAIADVAREGIAELAGPLPADTMFVPDHVREFDAVVAMYHDQGLPALKAASFGLGINVTLGLPFPRTSVDHGTALDLARDPALARTADAGSLIAATDLAIDLAAPAIRRAFRARLAACGRAYYLRLTCAFQIGSPGAPDSSAAPWYPVACTDTRRASGSARIFSPTRTTSRASSTRSIRSPATTWSRSGPASRR